MKRDNLDQILNLYKASQEENDKKLDRSIRTKGALVLFIGFISLFIFVFIPVIGTILEGSGTISILFVGLLISIFFLAYGSYLAFGGLKAKRFFDRTIRKSFATLLLFYLFYAAAFLSLMYLIRVIFTN